ncbi:MAG: hypothetical protein AAFR53_15350 [Pseudomonadota bacterium]
MPLLVWVFVLTHIATDLRVSFRDDEISHYAKWFEAAASLACDVYALNALGHPDPNGHDRASLWQGEDPHLR